MRRPLLPTRCDIACYSRPHTPYLSPHSHPLFHTLTRSLMLPPTTYRPSCWSPPIHSRTGCYRPRAGSPRTHPPTCTQEVDHRDLTENDSSSSSTGDSASDEEEDDVVRFEEHMLDPDKSKGTKGTPIQMLNVDDVMVSGRLDFAQPYSRLTGTPSSTLSPSFSASPYPRPRSLLHLILTPHSSSSVPAASWCCVLATPPSTTSARSRGWVPSSQ